MPETVNATDTPDELEHPDTRIEPAETAPFPPSTWPSGVGVSRGQTLFEYAMIILFVVLAVVLSLALIAPALNNIFDQVPGIF